ncbi:MAG: right-handed parallel beta-helix repeat-containing protein [Pirellulales bacterium]
MSTQSTFARRLPRDANTARATDLTATLDYRAGRRSFLRGAAAVLAGYAALPAAGRRVRAGDPPAVSDPRATSGDRAQEPDWQERLTITVGPRDADIVGTDHRALQAAVDYVAGLGGGSVQIRPGMYRLRNAVYMRSGVRLVGAGDDSILFKEPSASTTLAADSDWYDQEITLTDASEFRVGDGICLRTKNPHHGGTDIAKRTLVARSGARFKLDRPLRQNFWKASETTCSSLFPLVSGEEVSDFAIENLILEGNKQQNDLLDGNYAGCIFLQDISRAKIRGVTARNFNGDGISFQVAHDVTVEGCHSHDNTGLGLHPGSGSQRPVLRRNRIERNDIGIFFCWGVKFGLAEDNTIADCRKQGISIGHRDTDNVIRRNRIEGSGQVGLLFRPERGRDFAPHRTLVVENEIENSGPPDGIAIDVQGEVDLVTLIRNTLRETRSPAERVAIKLGPATGRIEMVANRPSGFAEDLVDLRTKTEVEPAGG